MNPEYQHALVGARHLLDLINEILDLAKIEAGAANIEAEKVPIATVLDDCIEIIRPEVEKEKIEVLKEYQDGKFEVFVDRLRLRQIVLNLLSNAIKYNNAEGKIRVRCQNLTENTLRLTIADDGEGIPEKMHSQLFVPFSRLGRETSEVVGTGIGLSITKQLVEMMDGKISFRSVEGYGTEFYVDLPRLPRGFESNFIAASEPGSPDQPEKGSDAAPQIILYVEDNPANVELMRQITSHIDNVDFHTVRTAELGVTLAQRYNPDLILMDINLPGISGFDALDQLRCMDKTKHIPVVAISADGTEENINKGMDAGFENYLVKPFDVGRVMTTIIELLNEQKTRSD